MNSKFIHSNLALRYLRSYCKDLPVEIELREFNINQNLDYIFAEIYKSEADLVGFSCYIWNLDPTLQLCSNLKKVREDMDIVLGGPEVSFDSTTLLKEHPYIDYIVREEGEETFYNLLDNILQDKKMGKMPGLTYRYGDEIIDGPDRPFISDLDQIPSPFIEDLDQFENKLVYYESSRGCPFNCQYCLSSTFKGVRTFSLERVKRDLKRLIDGGTEKIKFVDRTFNFDSEHALEIMRFALENRKNTAYHFEMTAHMITDEMLEFLKDVPKGLFQFEIGVQTTHKPTLKKIKRGEDFERLTQVVKTIASYGSIHLHLDLIAGLPDEDYQRFKKSFNDVFSLGPDNLQLGFLKLLKGSGIRENADDYGYKYISQPPYEVLSNDKLSFDQVLELKMVEDILDTYYNSYKFSYSVDFIISRNYQDNPYLFFQELKDYWEDNDYHKRRHKESALFEYLFDFYSQNFGDDLMIFQEYLKFDYLRNFRKQNLPPWLNDTQITDYKNRCYTFVDNDKNVEEFLPGLVRLSTKKIMRKILIKPFAFDIFAYREKNYQGQLKEDPIFILFNYNSRDIITGQVIYERISI